MKKPKDKQTYICKDSFPPRTDNPKPEEIKPTSLHPPAPSRPQPEILNRKQIIIRLV